MTAKRKRRAEGRLRAFIEANQADDSILPFTHITRAYAFDEILQCDELVASECDVFNERLIYLFYGRPAYRAKNGNNARMEFEWPIVFIFDPNSIGEIKRIFPFDTGAFHQELYRSFFDPSAEIDDFSLTPSLISLSQFVQTFYQGNDEYYSGYSRKNVDIPLRQFEAQSIQEMSRLPGVQTKVGNSLRDDRSSAVEIQVDHPISLSQALLAIVLPDPYIGEPDIQAALKRWNVEQEVYSYATIHNQSGEAWVGAIYEIVKNVYKKLGYLK